MMSHPVIIQLAEQKQQEQDKANAQQAHTAHQECNIQQTQDTMCQAQEQPAKQNVEATQYTAQEQETPEQQQYHPVTIQQAELQQQEQDNQNVPQVHTVQEVCNLIALQEHMEVQQA